MTYAYLETTKAECMQKSGVNVKVLHLQAELAATWEKRYKLFPLDRVLLSSIFLNRICLLITKEINVGS